MIWLENFDVGLRGVTQTGLFWLGKRWGLTRRGVVVACAWASVLVPLVAIVPDAPAAPLRTSIGFIMSFLVNGMFALFVRRGLKLVERNESWGTYTNWVQWRWFRQLQIFILPVQMVITTALVSDGEWWEICTLAWVPLALCMFYAITLCEFPPRQTKKKEVTGRVHAGAH